MPSSPWKRGLIHRRAENGEMVAYTAEEYGVRKDDGRGLVKPVNSSGGLLFLAILASLLRWRGRSTVSSRSPSRAPWEILGEIWWTIPACILVPLRRLGQLRQGAQGRETAQSPQPPPAG